MKRLGWFVAYYTLVGVVSLFFGIGPASAQQAPSAPALTAEQRSQALGTLYEQALTRERQANERAAVLETALNEARAKLAEYEAKSKEAKKVEEAPAKK